MCKTATIEKYAHERNDRAVTKVFAQARPDGLAPLQLEEMGKRRDLSHNRPSNPLLSSLQVSPVDGNTEDVMQEKVRQRYSSSQNECVKNGQKSSAQDCQESAL